jgi:hypothetical protein
MDILHCNLFFKTFSEKYVKEYCGEALKFQSVVAKLIPV